MPRLIEGKLAYDFPQGWRVTKYDDWSFYRNQFQLCCTGSKAVDFLGLDPAQRTLWMVELKDYRIGPRDRDKLPLWEEVALKTRDTLAGLFAAAVERGHDDYRFARQSLACAQLRLVLHLEQPTTNSKLFPRVFDRADVQQKLKQLVKPIDAHPRVIELQHMAPVPWKATSL